VNWQIKTGPQSWISPVAAADIVLVRLAYIVEHGSSCNQAKLLGEALEYGRALRGWLRANQPVYEHRDTAGRNGKPGPMSDG
jgi:hypothetical protein